MIVAVSSIAWDGYPFDRVAESLASIGATHVEPAWVPGLTEPFDETVFGAVEARRFAARLAAHGLTCRTVCAPLPLTAPGAVDGYRRRMDFAVRIGAQALIAHAGAATEAPRMRAAVERLLRDAERRGVRLLLSNAGDGDDPLARADDARAFVAQVASPWLGLSWDPANGLLRAPQVDPLAELRTALPDCAQLHLKDLRMNADGWFHAPLGQGIARCAPVLALAAQADLPVTIEMPLRLHRRPAGAPSRGAWRVPLADIERALRAALQFVRDGLRGRAAAPA